MSSASKLIKYNIDYVMNIYDEVIKEIDYDPSTDELKKLIYLKIQKKHRYKSIKHLFGSKGKLLHSKLVENNIIVPYIPEKIEYDGCQGITKLNIPCSRPTSGNYCKLCKKNNNKLVRNDKLLTMYPPPKIISHYLVN
jgi:hypothetical protein